MISWLSRDTLRFPPPQTALQEPNGLLAAGGDLSPQRLLQAYRHGIFPWYNPGEPILWWTPNPRCVLYTERLHISRSLRKRLKRNDYQVTIDQDFNAVMDACAAPRDNSAGTWISHEMQLAYAQLHRLGHAHSVEVWRDSRLIGGLYGVAIGQMFYGESMFSRETDGSKIAFAWLVEQLKNWGYPLVDCQVHNPHLVTLGAETIPRSQFLHELDKLVGVACSPSWNFDIDVSAFGGKTP
ncbi:leucyl/phenylalanyl-tRNA--protein transferase [Marinobacterium nitratireducens]|uniref:Leucyl/phenylalanyl-tRNA--protein transferase n=1 Tax=Marinobacterium nitratireducens TaxID=518897 RepID=A0A917Z9I6_9GAMM|nr:leucyl/phenylalanyl-tRNA--protein transferase [Marinobacterium nitratireducens]GGO76908.1 leucyl/phenylalanyl-tRNA--protein transferase [Marinobacterium nitratireducens]